MRTHALLVLLAAVLLSLGCGAGGSSPGSSGSSGGSGSGTISISADTGCRLYVDGARVGTTNVSVNRSPGTYFVEGRDSSGGRRWSVNATVSAGKNTRVTQSVFCR